MAWCLIGTKHYQIQWSPSLQIHTYNGITGFIYFIVSEFDQCHKKLSWSHNIKNQCVTTNQPLSSPINVDQSQCIAFPAIGGPSCHIGPYYPGSSCFVRLIYVNVASWCRWTLWQLLYQTERINCILNLASALEGPMTVQLWPHLLCNVCWEGVHI